MKKILTLILILFFHCSFGQTKFFDENDRRITQEEFDKKKLHECAIPVFNESLGTAKILMDRTEKGDAESDKLNGLLNKNLNLKLKSNRPTIIIFYPSRDNCNGSLSGSAQSYYNWYKKMEEGTRGIKRSNFVYLFKSNEGLKAENMISWKKDPDGLIENTFFKYHYPCSSYVIVYKGKFKSFFGEFMKDQVWSDLEDIIK